MLDRPGRAFGGCRDTPPSAWHWLVTPLGHKNLCSSTPSMATLTPDHTLCWDHAILLQKEFLRAELEPGCSCVRVPV